MPRKQVLSVALAGNAIMAKPPGLASGEGPSKPSAVATDSGAVERMLIRGATPAMAAPDVPGTIDETKSCLEEKFAVTLDEGPPVAPIAGIGDMEGLPEDIADRSGQGYEQAIECAPAA